MRNDAPSPGGGDQLAVAVLMFAGTILVGLAAGAWAVGTKFATGRWGFSRIGPWHIAAFVITAALLIAALVALGRWNGRRLARQGKVDRKAQLMGDPTGLSEDAARTAAEAGRMLWDEDAAPGLHYGNAVVDGTPLYMDWRSTFFAEFGMGSGKSTGIIIPAVDQAPGNCLVTGMKRDVPDAIRWLCEMRGEWYCFDPMPICNYQQGALPKWWWNPIASVDGPVAARRLATIFASATLPEGATKHAFFDVKGPEILACLLLAAARIGKQMDQVYEWVQNPNEEYPVKILEKTDRLSAAFLRGIYQGHGDSKNDLFATAGNAIGWMTDPNIQEWITDTTGRPAFDPLQFVKPFRIDRQGVRRIKRDTLVLMARKEDGSGAPITAALLATVMRAAQAEAAKYAHGRYPIPFVMPLDELPNTAPDPTLPDAFSVLGSHGINPMAVVQNWAQATRAWQPAGAQQLWSASTIRLVGGGLADDARLAAVSKLVGQRWETQRSATYQGSVHSVQTRSERTAILDIDELGALRDGKFVALNSGSYAVMGQLVPWWERPELAWKVRKSLELYEPKGIKV